MSEAQPDFGLASAPVELQRYDDGRLHVGFAEGDGDGDGDREGDADGDGDAEGERVGDCVGEGLGEPGLPVQATPFRENEVGTWGEPFEEPLNPKFVLPPLGMLPL
ncbi:hypothetical protein GCM10011574_71580 [Microbispora bryophytorum]|uniref:Uncharacterized protein n=1 Tax=Microbispora bryophytorum TaxID=1460882 RepID=A0A8H9H650_9ACTN|nr:hypothetical protein GCM10011574_71580 [Microbispora bryophytorum]